MKSYLKWMPAIALGLIALSTARADVVIVGGSALLTQAEANQIGTWLGEGNIALTNIYTKSGSNDSGTAFHAAVDGKGPTISVFMANPETNPGYSQVSIPSPMLLGGYDPFSWNSSSTFNITADRSAFIFNLTTTIIQSENVDSSGQFQTLNQNFFGPTFGAGYDLSVGYLNCYNTSLDCGFASNFSYGATSGSTSITGQSGNPNAFSVGGLEVFMIAEVPEPSAWLLLVIMVAVCFIGTEVRRRLSSRP